MVGTNPVISKQGIMVNPGQTVKQAVKDGMKPVSYTHLTLPTIYSV